MFMAKGWGPTIERDGVICELPEGAKPRANSSGGGNGASISGVPEGLTSQRMVAYILSDVAAEFGISVEDLTSRKRAAHIAEAKFKAAYEIIRLVKKWSPYRIAQHLGVDRSTLLHRASQHQKKFNLPPVTCFDPTRKVNGARLRSAQRSSERRAAKTAVICTTAKTRLNAISMTLFREKA